MGQQGNDRCYGGGGQNDIVGGSNVVHSHDGADWLEGADEADAALGDNGMWLREAEAVATLVPWPRGVTWVTHRVACSAELVASYVAQFGGDGSACGAGDDGTVVRQVRRFDVVDFAGGNDTLYGHAGNDLLYGQTGPDVIYAGDGDDEAVGGFGDDEIWGGAGHDTICGDVCTVVRAYEAANASQPQLLPDNFAWRRNVLLENVVAVRALLNTSQSVVPETINASTVMWSTFTLLTGTFMTPSAGSRGPIDIRGNVQTGNTSTWLTHFVLTTALGRGNDVLDAGDGDDVVIGQLGDDVLRGGDGRDMLLGDWADTNAGFRALLPSLTPVLRVVEVAGRVNETVLQSTVSRLEADGTEPPGPYFIVDEEVGHVLPMPMHLRPDDYVRPFQFSRLLLQTAGAVTSVDRERALASVNAGPLIFQRSRAPVNASVLALAGVNATVEEQLVAALTPDVLRHADYLGGNDDLDGGAGDDVLVGDLAVLYSTVRVPPAMQSVFDLALTEMFDKFSYLGLQARTMSVDLDTYEDFVEGRSLPFGVGLGKDRLTGGHGSDWLFGDFLLDVTVVPPEELGATSLAPYFTGYLEYLKMLDEMALNSNFAFFELHTALLDTMFANEEQIVFNIRPGVARHTLDLMCDTMTCGSDAGSDDTSVLVGDAGVLFHAVVPAGGTPQRATALRTRLAEEAATVLAQSWDTYQAERSDHMSRAFALKSPPVGARANRIPDEEFETVMGIDRIAAEGRTLVVGDTADFVVGIGSAGSLAQGLADMEAMVLTKPESRYALNSPSPTFAKLQLIPAYGCRGCSYNEQNGIPERFSGFGDTILSGDNVSSQFLALDNATGVMRFSSAGRLDASVLATQFPAHHYFLSVLDAQSEGNNLLRLESAGATDVIMDHDSGLGQARSAYRFDCPQANSAGTLERVSSVTGQYECGPGTLVTGQSNKYALFFRPALARFQDLGQTGYASTSLLQREVARRSGGSQACRYGFETSDPLLTPTQTELGACLRDCWTHSSAGGCQVALADVILVQVQAVDVTQGSLDALLAAILQALEAQGRTRRAETDPPIINVVQVTGPNATNIEQTRFFVQDPQTGAVVSGAQVAGAIEEQGLDGFTVVNVGSSTEESDDDDDGLSGTVIMVILLLVCALILALLVTWLVRDARHERARRSRQPARAPERQPQHEIAMETIVAPDATPEPVVAREAVIYDFANKESVRSRPGDVQVIPGGTLYDQATQEPAGQVYEMATQEGQTGVMLPVTYDVASNMPVPDTPLYDWASPAPGPAVVAAPAYDFASSAPANDDDDDDDDDDDNEVETQGTGKWWLGLARRSDSMPTDEADLTTDDIGLLLGHVKYLSRVLQALLQQETSIPREERMEHLQRVAHELAVVDPVVQRMLREYGLVSEDKEHVRYKFPEGLSDVSARNLLADLETKESMCRRRLKLQRQEAVKPEERGTSIQRKAQQFGDISPRRRSPRSPAAPAEAAAEPARSPAPSPTKALAGSQAKLWLALCDYVQAPQNCRDIAHHNVTKIVRDHGTSDKPLKRVLKRQGWLKGNFTLTTDRARALLRVLGGEPPEELVEEEDDPLPPLPLPETPQNAAFSHSIRLSVNSFRENTMMEDAPTTSTPAR